MSMEEFNENIYVIFHQRTRTHLVKTNRGTHLVQTKSKDKESSKHTGRIKQQVRYLFERKVKLQKSDETQWLRMVRGMRWTR